MLGVPALKGVQPTKEVDPDARATPVAVEVDRDNGAGALSVTGARFVIPLAVAGGAAVLLGLQLVASARLRRVTAPRR